MPSDIFYRKLLSRFRRIAGGTPEDFGFLSDLAASSISSRLQDVKRDFPLCLFIGQGAMEAKGKTSRIIRCDHDRAADIEADGEALPFARESFDACICNLTLHNVSDLPGVLVRMRETLKPGGLFLASVYSGRTLWELRESLGQPEEESKGRTPLRNFPFADIRQLGAALQRAGFTDAVVDSETVTVTYADLAGLVRDLRGMGEANILLGFNRFFSRRGFLKETERRYRSHALTGGILPATFEISYLTGWKGDGQNSSL